MLSATKVSNSFEILVLSMVEALYPLAGLNDVMMSSIIFLYKENGLLDTKEYD
jgi:hypothetical protein